MKFDNRMSGLVYSTDGGKICVSCRMPIGRCACKQEKANPSSDGVVRVSMETRGRGGKSVTVIKGVSLSGAELSLFGKELKTACGSGGTVKAGVIELQGDHRDRAMDMLTCRGWVVKRAGG